MRHPFGRASSWSQVSTRRLKLGLLLHAGGHRQKCLMRGLQDEVIGVWLHYVFFAS